MSVQQPYIAWDEKSSTGVPILDEQHRSIVGIINTLHYFVERGQVEEVLRPTLEAMLQHTVLHFRTEEMLLADARYPGLAQHARKHKRLLGDIRQVCGEAAVSKDARPVLAFLRAWWLNHIVEEDRKYVPYVSGRKPRRRKPSS
jgi:hemerythrin